MWRHLFSEAAEDHQSALENEKALKAEMVHADRVDSGYSVYQLKDVNAMFCSSSESEHTQFSFSKNIVYYRGLTRSTD